MRVTLIGLVLVAATLAFATGLRADQIPLLIKALEDPNHRQGASIALVKQGQAAVGPLQKSLHAESPDLRVWSAYTLGELGPNAKAAVGDLCQALEARDATLRAAAAKALEKIASPQSATALANALDDAEVAVRQNAAMALGRLGSNAQSAAPKLVTALGDAYVRAQARAALIKIGPGTVESLTAALGNDKLRFDAILALRQIAPEAAEHAGVSVPTDADLSSLRAVFADTSRTSDDTAIAASSLAGLGEKGVAVLIDSFEEPRLARIAAQAVSAAASAVPKLIGALQHENAEVRTASAAALAHLGAAANDAAPDLIRLLADEDRHVRYQAVRTLHEFGVEAAPAVAALSKVVADSGESEPTRQWAVKTLVVTLPETHDAVVKALIEGSMEETNYGVRQLARQQLLKIDPRAAAAAGIK